MIVINANDYAHGCKMSETPSHSIYYMYLYECIMEDYVLRTDCRTKSHYEG